VRNGGGRGGRRAAVATHAVCALLGALVGAAGSFVQAASLDVGPMQLPYGVLLALGASAATVVAAGRATARRTGALLTAVAWIVAVLSTMVPRAEGDLVLAARWPAYLWVYGGMVVVGLSAVLAPVRPTVGRGPDSEGEGPRPDAPEASGGRVGSAG
jgi:hypothetical protein